MQSFKQLLFLSYCDPQDSNRCNTGGFFTTAKSSGRPIGLAWEDYAFTVSPVLVCVVHNYVDIQSLSTQAGAVSYGQCTWDAEVWNEIGMIFVIDLYLDPTDVFRRRCLWRAHSRTCLLVQRVLQQLCVWWICQQPRVRWLDKCVD